MKLIDHRGIQIYGINSLSQKKHFLKLLAMRINKQKNSIPFIFIRKINKKRIKISTRGGGGKDSNESNNNLILVKIR